MNNKLYVLIMFYIFNSTTLFSNFGVSESPNEQVNLDISQTSTAYKPEYEVKRSDSQANIITALGLFLLERGWSLGAMSGLAKVLSRQSRLLMQKL
jgi:hypothetical protein